MDDTPQELPEVKYRLTPKFELFVKYYRDPREKETYMNATRATIKAYNLDPEKQYGVARVMASDNIAKLNSMGSLVRDLMEDKGFTLETFINIALSKVADKDMKSSKWWELLTEMAAYRKTGPQVLVQNNTTVHPVTEVAGEKIQDWNGKFKEFLKQQQYWPTT